MVDIWKAVTAAGTELEYDKESEARPTAVDGSPVVREEHVESHDFDMSDKQGVKSARAYLAKRFAGRLGHDLAEVATVAAGVARFAEEVE